MVALSFFHVVFGCVVVATSFSALRFAFGVHMPLHVDTAPCNHRPLFTLFELRSRVHIREDNPAYM